ARPTPPARDPRQPQRRDDTDREVGVHGEPNRRSGSQEHGPSEDALRERPERLPTDVEYGPEREEHEDRNEREERPRRSSTAFGDREADQHREDGETDVREAAASRELREPVQDRRERLAAEPDPRRGNEEAPEIGRPDLAPETQRVGRLVDDHVMHVRQQHERGDPTSEQHERTRPEQPATDLPPERERAEERDRAEDDRGPE